MEETNIKVICRFRPLNESEQNRGSEVCVQFQSDTSLKIPNDNPNTIYTFDKVFTPQSSQQEIYNTAAKPIVESVMKGFNGTVFAYGQTSSGKTFTMMGTGPHDNKLKGIIPRMVETVFDDIRSALDSTEFVLKISYCEIYLEKIKDLIDPKKVNLKIHENKTTGVYIEGLTECGVASEEEVYDLMTLGSNNREVAYTNMNAGSSRSHSLFVITVAQTNAKDLSSKKGKLFLVDLAGSEKVGKTGAAGMRLEEAKNINKSLTVLGLVINNLTDGKSSHIPYRDSKLTRILQDSLGGNSKTSLIITCSPSPYNEAETVSTLKFGLRAKSIKNKAKVNREYTVAELKLMLARTQEDLESKNQIIKALEGRLKGELGIDFVMSNTASSSFDMEEIMSEIEEYKEKLSNITELYQKTQIDQKILEGEVKNIENSYKKVQKQNEMLVDKNELLEETCKDLESHIERHLIVKEKLEKNQEDSMKKLLGLESELRSKTDHINKLKQELNSKDFKTPARAISMSFAMPSINSTDREEIESLYDKISAMSVELKESDQKYLNLSLSYEEKLSSKNNELKSLFEQLEVIKKEKIELKNYVKQLEKNHEESMKSSSSTTEEKINQIEEYYKIKIEREREQWNKEKEEIMNDLNNRIERVIHLEMQMDNQKDLIFDVQKRMSIEQKESFGNTLDLQNKIQELNFELLKEKSKYDELKANFDVTQKKLEQKKKGFRELEDKARSLNDEIEIVKEKNKVYEETVQPCEKFNPRRTILPFNIQRPLFGGGMVSDPRRQSIMIKKESK